MKFSIENVRAIDKSSDLDVQTNIYIEENKIVALGDAPSNWGSQKKLEGQGLIATPAFIDIGTKIGTDKPKLESESKAAYAGGYTSLGICATSANPLDTPPLVQTLLEKAEQIIQIAPIAGITKNLAGKVLTDMGELKNAGAFGISNMRSPFADLNIMSLALKYAKGMNLKVFFYPEDIELKNQGVVHKGKVAIKMGLDGIPVSAETISLSRELILIQEIGVKSHFSGISAAASLDILQQARDLGVDFSADVAIANLCYTHNKLADYDTNFHLEPPLRTSYDKDELLKAVNMGKIEAISSGHTPVEVAYKNAPFAETKAGMSNLETLFSMGFNLVLQEKLGLNRLIEALTSSPAKILGFKNRGSLKVGKIADISLIDLNKKWTPSLDTWNSYATNNPLIGTQIPAKVVATIASGKLRYSLDGSYQIK